MSDWAQHLAHGFMWLPLYARVAVCAFGLVLLGRLFGAFDTIR